MNKNIIILQEQQFLDIINIIQQHRSFASKAVNEAMLFTAWQVGNMYHKN